LSSTPSLATVLSSNQSARAAAEAVIHEFFDELVFETVQQFASEKEKDLAASEQNSQSILDSALDCIIVIGDDGRVREWNIAAERLFGYPRKRAVGRELVDLIIPSTLPL
jgi:PAS domain-containing protein